MWFVPLITQILDMSVMDLLVTSYLDGPSQLAVCFQGVHLSVCPTKVNSVLMFLNHFLCYTPKIKEGKKFWDLSLLGRSTLLLDWTLHFVWVCWFINCSDSFSLILWSSLSSKTNYPFCCLCHCHCHSITTSRRFCINFLCASQSL